MNRVICCLIIVSGLSACGLQLQRDANLYFTSTPEAVRRIDELLRQGDWKTLGQYYDLAETAVERAALESGDFFIRNEPPAAPDPTGSSRYRHPFAPGFVFLTEQTTGDPNIVTVVVMREIEQGSGAKQRVLREFKMRRSTRGLQLLPP